MFDKIIQFSVKRKFFVGFITLGLSILLFILPLQVQTQQTVTLDEVITMAKKNNPRLKSATAAIERSRAAKGESWELGATSFDYSWGQLNGANRDDRQLNVSQSLGSIITPFYKNSLVKQQSYIELIYQYNVSALEYELYNH